ASTQNLNKQDAFDPENRRISILVLNHKSEESMTREDMPATTITSNAGGPGGPGNVKPNFGALAPALPAKPVKP
ncbi:MAG: chemotaxis protein MotB, partial [Caballeronia mineralivorans]|nr:chemotaxis protein MotB [Caballeronia mineralivorans]